MDNEQKQILDKILDMTALEQERYFNMLNDDQRYYIEEILRDKARPPATCDIFDNKASFADWITSHFYVPELNGPIWLAEYQIEALNEATKIDKETGLFKYSLIAWMDIKKSIKSCIAAAVALRMAFMREWASIKVVANKREQAQSRSYFYIVRSLKLNPETAQMIADGLIKINNYTIDFYFNNANIKALPLNPEGEAGGNDDLIIWTEAWAAKTKAAQTMYTEMVIPPNKYGRGFKWLESYAGFNGASPILEPIYENNVDEEYRIGDSEMYVNGRTFVLNNHDPHLPWQSPDYYAQQAKELRESEFNRVHRNMWQSSSHTFIDKVAIDLCKEKFKPLSKKDKLVVGVDAAYASGGDYFAIVGVTAHPTNKNKKLAQRISRKWRAGKNKTLQFKNENNPLDTNYPYGFLVDLTKRYDVICVVCDPFQLHSMISEFNQKRIAWTIPLNQQSPRTKADNALYHLIRDKEIAIQDDDVLDHLKNSDAN